MTRAREEDLVRLNLCQNPGAVDVLLTDKEAVIQHILFLERQILDGKHEVPILDEDRANTIVKLAGEHGMLAGLHYDRVLHDDDLFLIVSHPRLLRRVYEAYSKFWRRIKEGG